MIMDLLNRIRNRKGLLRGKIILLVAFVVMGGGLVFLLVENWRTEYYYQEGLRFYLSGSFQESQVNLESALKLDPADSKISKLLSRVLLEEALSQYRKREIERSIVTLSRAQEIHTESAEVKALMANLMEKIIAKSVSSSTSVKGFVLPQKLENASKTDKAIIQMIHRMIQKSDEDLKTILSRMEIQKGDFTSQLGALQSRSQREFLIGLTLVVLLFVAGLLAISFWLLRIVSKSQLALIQMMKTGFGIHPDAEIPFQEGAPSLPWPAGLKAQKIVAIEAELTAEGDEEIAERLLRPFLDDRDPWIKAKSARTLYRYNPDHAMIELKKMIETENEKTPVVLALGEIGSKNSIDLIIHYFHNFDKETEKMALQSLIKLCNSSSTDMDVANRIKEFLKEVQSKGEWVV